jgi:hypothetical protein
VQYGRQLLATRRWWSFADWSAGLELHVEVFDRMDGLQMLSARGRLRCKSEWNVGADDIEVYLEADPEVDIRGASFSAVSRDPEQRRFANIGAYFREGHRPEYPCSLCVRVTVRDQRTGRGGLLWEEGEEANRYFGDPKAYWKQRLPEGTKAVPSALTMIVGAQSEGALWGTTFFVCPEPDQDGVADEDRLYHVATGKDNSEGDDHPFRFNLESADEVKVGAMIRSLC